MKIVLEFSNEFFEQVKELGIVDDYHSQEANSNWVTYRTFSCVSSEVGLGYFDVSFMHHKTGRIKIEVTFTTDKPQIFVDIIKAIEPEARVMYYKLVTKRETCYA